MEHRFENRATFPLLFVALYLCLNLVVHLSLNKYLFSNLIQFQTGWQAVGTMAALTLIGFAILKSVWPFFKQNAGVRSATAKTAATLFTITILLLGYNFLTFIGVGLMVFAHSIGVQE